MGLLDALKQYASDVGGNLNPEIGNTLGGLLNYGKDRAKYIGGLLDDSAPINQDFQNWHKKTQLGLADLIAGKEGPQADYGYSQLMKMSGLAPIGMTAWHGSPHKFDKFSLDKIGTGEGAQAYGHGLYLAESPGVAGSYQHALSGTPKQLKVDGKAYNKGDDEVADFVMGIAGDKTSRRDVVKAINEAFASVEYNFPQARHAEIKSKLAEWGQGPKLSIKRDLGSLYKTDIPDEAVARFLDWDKPLSQQAPEVQAALQKSGLLKDDGSLSFMYNETPRAGSDMYERITSPLAQKIRGEDDASTFLRKQGIPGIRYLDGGSRSAGQGSSNFVAFDPEMIRILERNGQATGAKPWALGEWLKGQK